MTTFERIKQTARERGLTLNQLNNTAKLKNNIIYSWKSKTPSAESLSKVADVLGVSVDYLLGNTDDMHANKKADPSTPELIAAHWGIDLSELSDEEKGFVMGRAQDYVKGLVDAIEGRK